MRSWAKHPIRVNARLFWLGTELLLAAMGYARHCAFCSRQSLPLTRAAWLQRLCQRLLRTFQIRTDVVGSVPRNGLMVCNHLSYLDIIVLAALTPCLFVAKNEVRRWPVFGWFARLAGTIFVDRNKHTRAAQSVVEISAALRDGALVVLFPEGTSSGGETILPFKSSLLEPAAGQINTVTAGLIAYQLANGNVSEEVCYWKDMALVPHLVNLLSKGSIRASVSFTEVRQASTSRKELARQLHSEVLRMKGAFAT